MARVAYGVVVISHKMLDKRELFARKLRAFLSLCATIAACASFANVSAAQKGSGAAHSSRQLEFINSLAGPEWQVGGERKKTLRINFSCWRFPDS